MSNKDLVWKPQPKQAEFMSRPEFEALYGGAAGGGKSDALLAEALRQVHIPHYTAVIIRKSFPQLESLIRRSKELYRRAFPQAKYNESRHFWKFPSGAHIFFKSLHTKAALEDFQGQAYCLIAFDELTHFTWDEYSYLFSRCRPTGPGVRCYIRATCNPGSVGHGWVKDRYVTAAPPLTTIWSKTVIPDGKGGTSTEWRDRVFVPSTVYDNQELLNNDPTYLANLAMLPEAERNALLLGSWDSFDGQVFTEWRNDPAQYEKRAWTHVIDPFPIPKYWGVMRCFDYGYSRPFACYWIAYDQDGRMYAIREYYGCDGTPNRGIYKNPEEIAAEIKRIESEDPNLKGRKIWGVADPAIHANSGGVSVADAMAAHPNYIFWDKGDHTRLAGKMQWHYRLSFNDEGYPMFQCFKTCKHLIRTIPALVYSESDVEDVDTDGCEDHTYDAIRYAFMERPIAPRQHTKPTIDPNNPFADIPKGKNHNYYKI